MRTVDSGSLSSTASARTADTESGLRFRLVVNPTAGRGAGGRLGARIVERLCGGGRGVSLQYSERPGHFQELAEQAARDRVDALLVAGGDGTVAETVSGLMAAGQQAPALGIIPVGSGNDFAKVLYRRLDWRHACDRLCNPREMHIDVGQCNDRYFVNGLGVGFDAQVAVEANRVQWLRGSGVYLAGLAKVLLRSYYNPEVTLTHDGKEYQRRVSLLAVMNGRCIGGAFRIAPHARPDDGRLELVMADALSRRRVLGFLPSVMRGTHMNAPEVHFQGIDALTLHSETPLPVHGDGEIFYHEARQLDIRLHRGAVRLLC